MKATTVKVDGELLQAIEEVKPPSQTVTAFVRLAVQKAVERHRMQASAVAYRAFLRANPDERGWLEEWDRADLGSAPKAKGRGR